MSSEKLNPEVKAKWVAALRSGEYEQGVECLRTKHGGFCCLGVLCDLYSKEFGDQWDLDDPHENWFLDEESSLPRQVEEWAGCEVNDVEVVIRGTRSLLAEHNDHNDATFEEIADAIEKQL